MSESVRCVFDTNTVVSATHIISGDKDLLVLHPFRNIAIMTPAEFLQATEEKAADEKA
ncbi:MAG: hypothetical protein JW741_06355 [Sedimentisphaerales bacterium]|nr:hypothetical protein [Sedimentisphaerales bacterium]